LILVVDASVAVKWFVDGQWAREEDDVDRALELLVAFRKGQVELLQPPHFLAEVAAVLARVKTDEALDDLRDLMELDIGYVETPDPVCYERAVQLAVDLDHHVFDTLYHALALVTEGAVLVTADRRYHRKAKSRGSIVWLPEISFPVPGS
jgi:predicted nucleic acid-binding protein